MFFIFEAMPYVIHIIQWQVIWAMKDSHIGCFDVMWNKEIWAFSAISVNFWLPSECRADWFRGKSPKYGVFLNISLVGTYIRVIPSFSWSLRWNRSTGMTFTWNLIQISPTILNLFVVSRFEVVGPCNTIFRQMRLWLSIHVFKIFSSVLFPQ